jgi:hypothetical protein
LTKLLSDLLQIRINKNNFINDMRRKIIFLGPIKLPAVEKTLSGRAEAGIASTVRANVVNLG